MPDVSASRRCAHLLVVRRYGDARQDALRGRNLIGAHDQQQFFGRKHAIFCQDVQQGVPGKKSFRKVHQVRDDFIVCIGPVIRKLKAVALFLAPLSLAGALLLDMRAARGVAVILGVSTVGDHKNLDIFKQAR